MDPPDTFRIRPRIRRTDAIRLLHWRSFQTFCAVRVLPELGANSMRGLVRVIHLLQAENLGPESRHWGKPAILGELREMLIPDPPTALCLSREGLPRLFLYPISFFFLGGNASYYRSSLAMGLPWEGCHWLRDKATSSAPCGAEPHDGIGRGFEDSGGGGVIIARWIRRRQLISYYVA